MLNPETYRDPNRELKGRFLARAQRLMPNHVIGEHYNYPVIGFDDNTSTRDIYDSLQTLSDHWDRNLPDELRNDEEFSTRPIGYILDDAQLQLQYPEYNYMAAEDGYLIFDNNYTVTPSDEPLKHNKVLSYRDGGDFPPIRQISHFDDARPEELSQKDPIDLSDLPGYHDVTGRRPVRDAIDDIELPTVSDMAPDLDDLRSEIDRYKDERPRMGRDPKEEYRGGTGRDPGYRQRRGRGRMT